MALSQITINADVIDIQVDKPKANDIFLVDSNVWYWQTYSNASKAKNPPKFYQISYYPNYIKNVLNTNAKLFYCGISIAELAHRIEATEREIYEKNHQNKIEPKDYRRIALERQNVVSEIDVVCKQIKSLAQILQIDIDEVINDAAIARLSIELIDSYDAFLLEIMKKHHITNILTDDSDFVSVKGIRVFTANHNTVAQAKAQNKLITR